MTVRAPAGGVAAQQGVQIGNLFGVAVEDQPMDGYPVQLALQGAWELPKMVGEPLMTGEIAYWDAQNACVTKEPTDNLAIGTAIYDAKDPKSVIDVFLAPSVPVASPLQAGHGCMDLSGVQQGTTIDNSWHDIRDFTQETITAVGCTMDPATGQFSFQRSGAWRLDFGFNLTIDALAETGITYLRLWNVTKGQAEGSPLTVLITAGDPGLTQTRFSVFDLPTETLDDTYVFQIGGGSTLTSVHWWAKTIALLHIDRPESTSSEPPIGVEGLLDLEKRVTTLEERVDALEEGGGAQGFGEAFMTGDPVNIGTINSGQWLNLSQINALVGTPQGIAFTLGDGKFSFSTPGYWKLTVQVIGDGGYLNTVRNMGVRWVNITDGDSVIDETRWVVMTPAINLNVSTTTLIDDDSLGKEFRLQWGDPKEQHGASTTLTSMNIRVESIIADLQGAV